MERVLVALAAFLCCLVVGDAQVDFSPMISEEAIDLTSASDVRQLECSSSFMDLDMIFDMNVNDIVWLSIPSSDLSMATATNCSMAEGSANSSGSEDFSALADGLVVLGNGSFYDVSTAGLPNGGYVICVVNNTEFGMCRSNFTTVTVAPTVSLGDNQTFNRGEDVVLNCSTTTGGPELTFQWQFNGEILTGETSSNLTISSINATHGGMYTCTASNDLGNDSDVTVVSIAPYFTVAPEDTVSSNGTNVELNCVAEAFPPELQYQWRRVDGDIRSEIDTNSSVLRFSPVQFGDEGNYACMVTSSGLNVSSDNVSLTLSPLISFITEEQSYNRSDDVILTCSVQGGPENYFEWQFNGAELPGEMTENLTISNVNASNGGVYTCVVINTAGNSSADTSVFILPYFTVQPDSIGGTNGSRITLTCGAEAFPSPSYEWIRVGETIRSDLSVNSESLVLNPLLFGDEGDYVCNVNSSGTVISSNTVTISVSPIITDISEDQTLNRADNVTLNCSALGGPDLFFRWQFNGSYLEGENSSTLLLNNVDASTGGEYTCVVFVSSSSDSESVSVFISPYFLVEPEDLTGSNGSSVELPCAAEAFPSPTYQWVKEDDTIRDSLIISSSGNLFFDPLLFGDEGSYFCNVSSGDSSLVSDTVTLFVSPLINDISNDQTYNRGDNVTLNCSALGGPDPFFSWQFNGSYLEGENSSTLLLNDVDASTGGEYTCVVFVSSSNDSASVSVFISPYFLVEPEDITGSNGSSVALLCSAEAFPSPTYQWVKVNDTIRNNLTVSSSGNLLFGPLLFGDEGNYFCNVSSGDSSLVSDTVTLFVSPEGSVAAMPSSSNSQIGASVNLSCLASGGPENSFEWIRTRDGFVVSNQSVVSISINDSLDGGMYLCNVSNLAGFDSDDSTVNVSPSIEIPPMSMTIAAQENASFTCTASGFPAPSIEWKYDGAPLSDVSIVSTIVLGSYRVQSNLSIVLANVSDTGTYTCIAISPVDNTSDSETAILTVQAVPLQPRITEVFNVSSTSLSLKWEEPPINNAPIQFYRVTFINPPFASEDTTVINTTETTVDIESLFPGIEYSFTVVAVNDIGASSPSDGRLVRTLEEAPSSPPSNVTAMASSPTSIEVMWNEVPPIDQNGIITNYEVVYTPLNTFGELISSNSTNVSRLQLSVSLVNLEENVNYNISVTAYTSVGAGPASEDIITLTLQAVPARPPSDVAVMAISPRSINVTWNEVPPIDQNGIITFYEIMYLPLTNFSGVISLNSTNVSGTDLSVVLTDLEEYVNYSISVRAYTSVGPGPESEAKIELTLEDAPSNSPANVRAMASSSTSILVTWNEVPPIDQNGVIIAYEVMYSQLNDSRGIVFTNLTNVSGADFSVTLQYLEEYVNYSISVRAYTTEGPGPYSDAIVELTLEDIPNAAPRNFAAVSMTSTSIFVQWETIEILERNGEITVYEVTYTPLETFGGIIGQQLVNVSGQELSTNLTGLQEFVNYTISVRAYTSVGVGPDSAEVVIRTLPSAPSSPPVNTTVTVNSSSIIVVSWEAVPPINQNGIINMYQVMYYPLETFNGSIGPNVTNVSAADLSLSLRELEEFVNYSIAVRAFNSEGPSDFSDVIVQQTLEDAPNGFPTITNASVQSTRSIFVRWTEVPLILQNGIIIDYTVCLVPIVTANQPTVNETTSNLNITVDGLVPNTMYNISVTAATRIGSGPSSAPVEIETPQDTPGTVPPPPEVPSEAINATFVTLTWEAPPMPNGVITGYNVELFVLTDVIPESTNSRKKRATFSSVNEACIPGGRNRSIEVDASRTSLTIDAASNVTYQFRVQASTSVGLGDFSPPRDFSTPPGAPTPVRSLSGTPTSNSIEVTWNIPLCPNGEISGYNLYHRQADTIQTRSIMVDSSYTDTSLPASARSHTIVNLQPFRNYTIIVRAMVGTNVGEIDVEILIRTLSDVAPTPTLGIDRSTSQPPTRNQVPYLIPGPGQINTGTVILCVVVVVEGQLSGLSTYDEAQPYAQDSDFYIAAAWGESDIANVPRQIVIGDEQVYQVVFSGNTVRYTNVPLKAGTEYNFFTRYDIRNENSANQPFRVYSEPVVIRTQSPSPAGAIVGSLFAIIIVAVIIAVIVVLLIWWYRRGGFAYSKKSLEDVENSNNVELVQASFIKNHGAVAEEDEATTTVATHDPVPIEAFGKYVKQHHGEDNELFSDEYKEVEPKHSPTSNHTRNPENIQKNRYANITAYDHSRVKLEPIPGEANSDYINANYLDGYKKKNCFIAAQGPVPASVCDFWRMIWEQKVEYIVMVTNCEEKGRVKCHQYWPENSGTPAFYSPFHIYLQESLVLAEYTIRTLSLQKEGSKSERIVRQFHFTVWPDHGVPEYPSQLLHFVRKVMQEDPMKNGPMVVHCSAGVGRTGTFITLFAQLKRIRAERTVDVFNFVQAMRYRRCYMVQTEDQYVFIHDALLEAIECGVTEVPARDVLKRYKRLSNPEPGRPGMKEEFTKVSRTIHHQIFRTFSMMPAHKTKNRYNDSNLLPYDKTSVRLPSKTSGTDYINANYVDGYHKQRAYIATQGPLPETVDDFWKMVWDQKTTTIVMLVKEKELGRVKCHKYWPEKAAMNAEDLQVILHNETEFPDYVVREFKLVDSSDGASSQIKQFHFKDWPEDPDQTPENSSGLIDLIGQVQKWQMVSGDRPIVVHCSDGCGRTGVYLAISILLERLKNEGVVDVFQTVRTLRLQRPQTVANLAQYEFCYKTVLEFLDSFELYSNFK